MDEIERELGMAVRAVHLAGRHGQALPRRHGPARRAACACSSRARTAGRDDDEILAGLDNPAYAERFGARVRRTRETTSSCCAAPRRRSTAARSSPAGRRRCSSARRSTTSACARCSTRWSTSRRRPARAPAIAARRSQPDEREVHRRRLQDPGQHGPGAPRPHRLRARGLGPLRARHAAEGACARARSCGRTRWSPSCRSGASCSTRPMPATSSASPTTACCSSATRSPKARRCSSPGCRSSRRRCSARSRSPTRCAPSSCSAGLTQLGEEGAIQVFRPHVGGSLLLRRRRPAAVRGRRAPARARVRRQGAHPAEPLPGRALGHLRPGRRRRQGAAALHRRQRAPRRLRRGRRADRAGRVRARAARDREQLAEDQVPRAARARGAGVPAAAGRLSERIGRASPAHASRFSLYLT